MAAATTLSGVKNHRLVFMIIFLCESIKMQTL
jgi:hypothetical protein